MGRNKLTCVNAPWPVEKMYHYNESPPGSPKFGIGEGARRGRRPVRVTAHARAGLLFPVSRIRRLLRSGLAAHRSSVSRVSAGSAVCMAACMEYMVAEVLEQAIVQTLDKNKKIITPRFINLGIREDPELDAFLKNILIAGGGVLPHVQEDLFFKKPRARKH